MYQHTQIMTVFMNITDIAKRQSFDGFSGLKYGKNPEQFLPPPAMLYKPAFGNSVFKTMDGDDVQQFEQSVLDRQEFLENKHNMRGFRKPDAYEDAEKDGLAFDPLKNMGDTVGDASYDQGVHQGGIRGAKGYTDENVKTRATRGDALTLDNQDPYAHRLSNKIRIHQ